ncbi:hypothetical protein D6833_07930 [Candidatus Parcubacteria bacterium]|nr:MAG: hypothetical protein D6833_07930 [Candidatus Parcubacteria bacterium]
MPSKEEWESARKAWEASPTLNFSDIAGQLGVTRQGVRARAKREGWEKRVTTREVVEKAHLQADRKTSDPGRKGEKVEDVAVDLRARLLERHRKEWDGVRQRVYEALRNDDFEKAKLGKISAESIRIIQDGERKAWGLDVPAEQSGEVRVVVERREDAL